MKIYKQELFSFCDNELETDAESLQEVTKWGRSTMFAEGAHGLGFAIEADIGDPVEFVLENVIRDDDGAVLFWELAPVDRARFKPEHKGIKVLVHQ